MNKKTLAEFLKITLGTGIVSAGVFFFLLPSEIPLGSVAGLAMVMGQLLPLPISVITFILNAALLVIGFIFIGKEFGGKTVYTSILMPIYLWIFERIFPNFTSIMGSPVLDVICDMFLVSIGQSILFNCNASSGGLDIVGKLMNKFLHIELGRAMSLSGIVVAALSIVTYDIRTVVLSVLGTYICGMVLDHFIFGASEKRKVCILSPKIDEIQNFILSTLNSGATIYEAVGAYDQEPRREINTIVNKNEYRLLMDFLTKVDAEAFVTVYSVYSVSYRPKVPGGPSQWVRE